MNLIESIQAEQKRCRELATQYERIGTAGAFGRMVILQAITLADRAVASGEAADMLRAYEELKNRE